MTDDSIIHEAAQRLIDDFNPIKIVLFGSRARRDATPDSDLDRLVVMPDGVDRHPTAVAMRRRLANIRRPKDVIVTTPGEIMRRSASIDSVLVPALRQGRVLHERA
jgi:predicted nucleotidyltransferase